MNNNFINKIITCLFILNSANLCFAEMEVQELKIGYPSTEKSESGISQNFTTTETKTNVNNKQTTNNTENDKNNIMYLPSPYYNGNSVTYQIGPYPARGYYGMTRSYYMPGGYNYKGFSYNYGIGKKPIYIKVPVGPFPPNGGQKPPPPPPQNKPDNNHGNHQN